VPAPKKDLVFTPTVERQFIVGSKRAGACNWNATENTCWNHGKGRCLPDQLAERPLALIPRVPGRFRRLGDGAARGPKSEKVNVDRRYLGPYVMGA